MSTREVAPPWPRVSPLRWFGGLTSLLSLVYVLYCASAEPFIDMSLALLIVLMGSGLVLLLAFAVWSIACFVVGWRRARWRGVPLACGALLWSLLNALYLWTGVSGSLGDYRQFQDGQWRVAPQP